MEEICSSTIPVCFCQTTWHCKPEGCAFHSRSSEHIRSNTVKIYLTLFVYWYKFVIHVRWCNKIIFISGSEDQTEYSVRYWVQTGGRNCTGETCTGIGTLERPSPTCLSVHTDHLLQLTNSILLQGKSDWLWLFEMWLCLVRFEEACSAWKIFCVKFCCATASSVFMWHGPNWTAR
jgi:hypothetical protein